MKKLKEITQGEDTYVFYEVDTANEILNTRHIQGKVAEMYIKFGLSRDFISGIATLLKEQSRSAKDITELQDICAKVAFNIEERIGLVAETKQYEELACIYTKIEVNGELEPDDYLPEWQAKKKKVWNKDKKLRDFFLSKEMKRMHGLKGISKNDMLHALKVAEQRIAQLPTLANSLMNI